MLPPRELQGAALGHGFELRNPLEHLSQTRRQVGGVAGPAGEADVLLDREPGDQATIFRHVANSQPDPLVGRHRIEALTIHADVASAAWQQPCDRLHERGLARTVATDQSNEFAASQFEARISDDFNATSAN